jgi:hypothetical protein
VEYTIHGDAVSKRGTRIPIPEGQMADLCQQILKAPTAAAAKQIQVTNDWNDRRQFLMADLRDLKFRICPPFRQTLLSSDDFYRPHRTRHLLGDRHRQAWPGTRNVFGLLLARLRNRHQIADKTRVVVLGHIFISYLKTRIGDGSFSWRPKRTSR